MRPYILKILIFASLPASVQGVSPAPESPRKLLESAMETRLLTQSEGNMTGEGAAWHAAWSARRFLPLAKNTGDSGYVEAAITYFDALLDKTYESPDGYRGWVGPYIYDQNQIGDVHISDAILVNPMLDLAGYILAEAPESLRLEYTESVRSYIRYADKHVLEKWEARKTWWEDGPYGAYFAWDHYLNPETNAWEQRAEVKNSNLGLPFNKNMDMAITHLRVFLLTGNPEHRAKARKIFNGFKSRLSLFKNSYTWNYWEPVCPGDILSVDPPKMSHWVGTHPYRDYQAGEIENVIEAFHAGITFSLEDIDRFIAANLMMWNGDFDGPSFVNSDFAVWRAVDPDYEQPEPSPAYGGPAGTNWGALAEFSEPLARLAGRHADNLARNREKSVAVDEFDFPFSSSRMLAMVFAMPSVLEQGDELTAGCKVRSSAGVQVQLVSNDGMQVLETIDQKSLDSGSGGHAGLHFLRWKANCDPGEYRLRWVIGSEYRDYPIQVK